MKVPKNLRYLCGGVFSIKMDLCAWKKYVQVWWKCDEFGPFESVRPEHKTTQETNKRYEDAYDLDLSCNIPIML
jgi:hypothetical protein